MISRYQVTLSAFGKAVVVVEAPDADRAVELALRDTTGLIVEGGECGWDVEEVEELQREDVEEAEELQREDR